MTRSFDVGGSQREDGDEVRGVLAGGTLLLPDLKPALKEARRRSIRRQQRPVVSGLTHALAFGITAAAFLILSRPFYAAAIGYDEEFLVWGGWGITKGLVPYRDFIALPPPMVLITHALALALFGLENQGFRILFAALPLASALVLQASLVARGIERFLAMAVVLGIVSLFLGPWQTTALSDPESIGFTYFMLGLALLLRERRYVKATTVAGGFFLLSCVMCSERLLPVVVATWVGLFFLRGQPQPSRASRRLYATYSAIGAAALAVALSVYMLLTGAMGAYVAQALGHAAAQSAEGQLMLAARELGPRFLNENVLGYLAPLGIPGAIFAFRRSRKLFAVMVLALVCGLWAAAAPSCSRPDCLIMSAAGVIFVVVASVDSLKPALAAADRTVRTGVSVAAVLWMSAHLGQQLAARRHDDLQKRPWPEPAPGLMAIIAKNTAPTDRIFTTGPPLLYAQANRLSAVREDHFSDESLESYPGKTDEEKLRPIRDQLVSNKPRVVFLDPEQGDRKVRHDRALMMPFLTEFHYQEVARNIYVRP